MPSLQELKKQIVELEQQAAELHKRESAEAIETIKDLVSRYGLSAQQIGLGAGRRPGRKSPESVPPKRPRPGAGVAKYMDPTSGKTWTGFGKPPGWIAGVEDRDAFLISKARDQRSETPRKKVANKARASK